MMEGLNWKKCCFFGFVAIFTVSICYGDTDPRDVTAINSLYASLGQPQIPGWVPYGGDPCGLSWQGVQCVNSNITAINLSGANLAGQLPEDLGDFASIIRIDFSHNRIGGGIPLRLPFTLQELFLSDNQLIGSIPPTLSSLGQLVNLGLNDNHLVGVIPDAFQQLKGLLLINLSGNQLIGQLPASMGDLSSLSTLHLQNNQLTGNLNVIQYLPLLDLDISNNLFSGPIPVPLLNIRDFKRDGNPFNTSVIPSPPALTPSESPLGAPPHESPTGKPIIEPSSPHSISEENVKSSSKKTKWLTIAGVILLIFLALGLCLFITWCCKKRQKVKKVAKSEEIYSYTGQKETKVVGDDSFNGKGENVKRMDDHKIDISPPSVNVSVPTLPLTISRKPEMKSVNSVNFFTIASLQQHTNSFSQENFVGDGLLGTVYKAELPSGKLLAVKKLNIGAIAQQREEEFIELVAKISKIKHANINELVGYCIEHGQRLLVYEYCTNGTLYEALHLDEKIHKSLSWNARMGLALQTAKALEYLHEECEPPIMHRNLKAANILLHDDLTIRVSDCGLATLLPPNSITQLQGHGYGAPELELGGYTHQSDVYSFGVIMLELLTGRKSYDRSRPRGEQSLVRWAIPRLHDIDTLSKMVDPSLNGAYPSKSLSRLADIISLCIQRDPEFRPPMSEIIESLLHIIH